MTLDEKIHSALTSNTELMSLVSGVYKNQYNPAASFPVIVFWSLSSIPIHSWDDAQKYGETTIQVNILTKDGRYDAIYAEVEKTMSSIGGVWSNTVEIQEKEFLEKVSRWNFVIPLNRGE